jgi:threonine dehydratase
VKLRAGTRVVSIVSGGNVDPERVGTILEGRVR